MPPENAETAEGESSRNGSDAVLQPTLRTARLVLRPFTQADAPHVRRLADDAEIAANTLTIPHPYPEGAAETWIATHAPGVAQGIKAVFAITDAASGELLGAIGLEIEPAHDRAELGYWIGRPFWGRGIATEAAREVLAYAFSNLGLARVLARHFPHNPASGQVLQKLGMRHEGTLRSSIVKGGRRLDEIVYGILREEWKSGNTPTPARP